MTLGAVPYVLISLAIFGMVLIVFGMLVDEVLITDNQLMADPSLPYSNERGTTMVVLSMCFKAMGFVAVVCAGIFLVMNGVQAQSGEV
jgi:hypothetical protein